MLRLKHYFYGALSSALYKPERSEGNSMWIKRTMASEASQSVYISDHNNAERSEAKVFIYYIVSERRTSEASQLTRVYIL